MNQFRYQSNTIQSGSFSSSKMKIFVLLLLVATVLVSVASAKKNTTEWQNPSELGYDKPSKQDRTGINGQGRAPQPAPVKTTKTTTTTTTTKKPVAPKVDPKKPIKGWISSYFFGITFEKIKLRLIVNVFFFAEQLENVIKNW